MKKIMSVLLAGAMVLGMSVASFAKANDQVWGDKEESFKAQTNTKVTDLSFAPIMKVEHTNKKNEWVDTDGVSFNGNKVKDFTGFRPGDVLYFAIMEDVERDYSIPYGGDIDPDWSINISANDYVEYADWVEDVSDDFNFMEPQAETERMRREWRGIKVVLAEDLDELDLQEIHFHMYIADNEGNHTKESAYADVKYEFKNYEEEIVDFKHINDVDYTAKWIVEADKRGVATFDFEDEAYFTVKMYPEEEVILNFDTKADKDLVKEYRDIDLEFYNFNGTKDEFLATGELLLPADKDSVVYEVVDGKLVEVDAEYVKDYKVAGVEKKSGLVIETAELGHYVVASEELDIEEEKEEDKKPSSDKKNPAMGGNDFVGAAVAMAVVSVAAAGALALKK